MHGASERTTRPVGRLAPSPTGRLHLGHARSFLLAWWQVRAQGGLLRLRIEDLDRERCRPEFVDELLRDLEWLGLDWDGEARLQSSDTSAMERACAELVERGLAYPCVCTRAEIAELSAPNAGELEPRYPGTCSGRWRTRDEARARTGREAGLRLSVPAGAVRIEDGFVGAFSRDVQADVGDFLIQRRDGAFAYQLAVVVDDALAQVDTVLRGDDLLASAPRQWHLQSSLRLPHPSWFHVPLVLDAQGERLAKRRGDAATLASLRTSGVDARAVVAWAARSSGQADCERITAAEIARDFVLARVPPHACRLAPQAWERIRAARV